MKPEDDIMAADVYKKDDAAETTVSLSDDHQISVDAAGDSEQVNRNRTFYQDFFGFSSEEWSRNKDSPVVVPKQPPVSEEDHSVRTKGEETNPMFRSKSVSFKYMRFIIAGSSTGTGTRRSKSVSALASKSKSRWQVFMSGFGSGKFPTKMDLVDIKNRQQLHPQSVISQDAADHGANRSKESGDGKTGGRKAWWRLVDVLGCSGRYDIMESFHWKPRSR